MKLSSKITTAALSTAFLASAIALPAFGASCGQNSGMPFGLGGHRGYDRNYNRDYDRHQNCSRRDDCDRNQNCGHCYQAKMELYRVLNSNADQHTKREAWKRYTQISRRLNCEDCNRSNQSFNERECNQGGCNR